MCKIGIGTGRSAVPPSVHESRLKADSPISPQGFHALRQDFSPHRAGWIEVNILVCVIPINIQEYYEVNENNQLVNCVVPSNYHS
jgi:hypothetical protein